MLSRRFSAYSAVESKAFRLREVFGPTGPIQRGSLHWGDRLGSSHAFVARGGRTSPQYGVLSFFAFELNIVPYRNCLVLASYLNTGAATLIKIYSETVNRS